MTQRKLESWVDKSFKIYVTTKIWNFARGLVKEMGVKLDENWS